MLSLFRMSYLSHKDDCVQEGILDQEEERFVNQDLLGLLEEGRKRADLDTCKINEAIRCCIMGNGTAYTLNELNYFKVLKE